MEQRKLYKELNNVEIPIVTYNLFDPMMMIELPDQYNIVLNGDDLFELLKQLVFGITKAKKQTGINNLYPLFINIKDYNIIKCITECCIFSIIAICSQYCEEIEEYIDSVQYINFIYGDCKFGHYPDPNNIVGINLVLSNDEEIILFFENKPTNTVIEMLRTHAAIGQLFGNAKIE